MLGLLDQKLGKIIYSHFEDLGLHNFADTIKCPVQLDPTKFQRDSCRAITDKSKKELIDLIQTMTSSLDPRYQTRVKNMPYAQGLSLMY